MDIEAANSVTPDIAANLKSQIRAARRPSRGGLDEINPDDVIYGEYAYGTEFGEYLDLLYVDEESIRSFSGPLIRPDKTFDELVANIRDDKLYYVVDIKEVDRGFAFKRHDITDIALNSVIQGGSTSSPSCVWTMKFKNGRQRTVEAEYQSYFIYGTTTRPSGVTNAQVLDKNLSTGE